MVGHGWMVTRADTRKAPGRFFEGGNHDVPVLVHRCSDEKTLTAAAGHLSRGAKGMMVVLLGAAPAPLQCGRRGMIRVLCPTLLGALPLQCGRGGYDRSALTNPFGKRASTVR